MFVCFLAMCDLGVDFIETLILALPELPTAEASVEALKAFWEVRIKLLHVFIHPPLPELLSEVWTVNVSDIVTINPASEASFIQEK